MFTCVTDRGAAISGKSKSLVFLSSQISVHVFACVTDRGCCYFSGKSKSLALLPSPYLHMMGIISLSENPVKSSINNFTLF